jgi:hypothetical protein
LSAYPGLLPVVTGPGRAVLNKAVGETLSK